MQFSKGCAKTSPGFSSVGLGVQTENYLLGPSAAFLSALIWSVAASVYARLSIDHQPSAINATRAAFGIALNALAATFYFGGIGAFAAEFQAVSATHLGWYTISMFAGLAFGDVLFLRACTIVGVPSAMAIGCTYPIWSAIAGFLFLGQTLRPVAVIGLLVTICGVLVVILSDRELAATRNAAVSELRGRRFTFGVALAFGSSLLWALNTFATSEGSVGLHVFAGITLRLSIGLALCPLIGLFVTGRPTGLLRWAALRPVLWVFAIEGALGTTTFLIGMKYSPLAVGATLASLSPVLAVIIARTVYRQRVPWQKTAGIGAVVVGLALLVS